MILIKQCFCIIEINSDIKNSKRKWIISAVMIFKKFELYYKKKSKL